MKYIKVPEDVKLTTWHGEPINESNGEQSIIKFKDFVIGRLMDAKFSKDMSTILRAIEIKSRVDKMETELALEDVDWKLLNDVTESPSPQQQYNPNISHCLVPFFMAVTKAETR